MDDSEEEETEAVVASSSEGEEAFPFEDVEERNGLPLLRRRFGLDGKSAVLLYLIISASIALVGVEKSAV
jgi:hypothetical protein